ncbi:membrane protein insertase YidC [Corallococcus sp. ZKHCc1 1396]|uniref:Membrane protein insertase YidC n=2 Tax=Corallococcus soli TaxID=2710757 RepID=A0ABR9PWA2_9BACT|nr:membrane protein insertase YidC [Corallococcus soli]MBE4752216.1 membrane protein insertase YidC [Corallococcus soli]
MTNDPLSPQSNDSQKRLLLALALSFAATAAYTFFFAPTPSTDVAGADAGVELAATQDAGTPAVAAVPPPGTPTGDAAGAPGEPPPPARTVDVARPEVKYAFSSEGAGLTSAVLQGVKMREQQSLSVKEGFAQLFGKEIPPPPQMNVANPVAGQPLPLAVSIEGGAPLAANTRYAVQENPTDNGGSLVFTGRQGPWEITKTVLWPREGFEFAYTLQVRNTSAQAQSGELKLHYSRAIDPEFEHAPSFFGGVGNLSRSACWVGDELHKLSPGDSPPDETRGQISYFGIDQQYFLSALYPLDGPLAGNCTLVASPTAREVSAAFPLNVASGQTATFRFGGYLGPKDPDLLLPAPGQALRTVAGLSATTYHPRLEDTVDFGIWAVVCKLLLAIMRFFYGLVGNWGFAIILLTVVVKMALLPLTYRSMVSMEAVKVLQPKMEEIRKKFAEDKERQNLEIMKLYQEAKVNPLGGCLPLLIQMPVWIALFTALRNSFEIYGEPFIGPIWRDLTYKDPTYLLPLALGVSMIITQKMQPQMMDAAQAKMMTWVMPIIFTFTLLQYPAGLSLYIFTNNVLSIGQQYGLRKWLDRKKDQSGGGTPAVVTAGGGKRK